MVNGHRWSLVNGLSQMRTMVLEYLPTLKPHFYGPVLQVNIPAPWFASVMGIRLSTFDPEHVFGSGINR